MESNPNTTPESAVPTVSATGLSSPLKLIAQTWPLYKSKLLTFVWLALIGAGALILSLLLPVAAAFFLMKLPGPWNIVGPGICAMVAVVFGFYVFCLFQLAYIIVASRQTCSVKEAIRDAKPGTVSFLWIGGLLGLVLLGGYLLFFVPGIIFTVWFGFWTFTFAIDGCKGMNGLLRSRELVRGKWWPVAWLLFVAWFVSTALSFVPLAGPILALLLIPFNLIYTFLIYQELKSLKTENIPPASFKSKFLVLLVSFLGYVMIWILLFFFAFAFLAPLIAKANIQLPGVAGFSNKKTSGGQPESRVTLGPSGNWGAPETAIKESQSPAVAAVPAPPALSSAESPAVLTNKPLNNESVATILASIEIPASVTIFLKSGQSMSGSIVEKDSNGVWFEVGRNARVYLTPGDIKGIEQER